MHLYNNLDVRRAVIKLFGDRAKDSIKIIEKTGTTFKVYVEWAHLEPISELPDGVYTYCDRDCTVVVFERRDVEVS